MFKYSTFSIYAVFALWLLSPPLLHAEGELTIKPGQYRITKTTKTNFDTVPATRTSEECITDPDLDPESILPSKDNCKITNLKSTADKTTFDFTCTEPGNSSTLKGYAEYGTTGNSISSQVKLEGSYKGQKLIVESSGLGERIGDCAPPPEFVE